VADAASPLAADIGLLRHPPPAAIGLTQAQWRELLKEAALTDVMKRLGRSLTELEDLATAEGAAIARELRPAAIAFAAEARKVSRLLWQLAAFTPDSRGRPAPGVAQLTDGLTATLDHALTWLAGGLNGPGPTLSALADSPGGPAPGVPDPIAASFGVDGVELFDRDGRVSSARLLAVYRNRLPQLGDICEELLYSITQPPIDLFATLEPLLTLLRVERPLLAWTVANQALGLVRQAAASADSNVVDAFTQLRRRAAARDASRDRLAAARRAAELATTEGERTLAELSAYRITVEGQVRPWAWALLRLTGAQGAMPMVAELRDRLTGSSEPLLTYVADALIPALRNADAHEEAHFDQLRGQLAIGDELIDHSTLRSANATLAALDGGLELALACARAQVAPIAQVYALRPGDPRSATEALSQAEQRYGHAGLRVWSLRRDRTTVKVVLDEIDPLRFSNPCFLATLQANQLVAGVTRWQIGLRVRDGWVIDLPASVLRENWPIFERAAHWFPEIPQETFLPCVTWARLAIEMPGVALRSAAWLALNDLQHAIEEAEALSTPDIAWFARRVQNVIGACAATLRVMPPAEAQPLQLALFLARDIRYALGGMPTVQPLEALIPDVLRERNRLPVPAVMPTLDQRPLDIAEEES
jgi:hypothetical protein